MRKVCWPLLLLISLSVTADELWVERTCPVTYQHHTLGILALSKPWYHSSRSQAAYIARDNATGIGIEIHFFKSADADLAQCSNFRLLQVRSTSARLFEGEQAIQVDIPDNWQEPFYDSGTLEHGRGVHLTPADTSDKPWTVRPVRASSVALYDTPYVSDAYGIEGTDIEVRFETCVVCERDGREDSVLSCGQWGYTRDYIDEADGWSEPVAHTSQCRHQPSPAFRQAANALQSPQYREGQEWQLAPTNPLADGQFAALAEAQRSWQALNSGAGAPLQTDKHP